MKHQNAERLEEEQKKYRETVDKIQRQAENEIEFLKMRYQEDQMRNENHREKIKELKQQILETKTLKEKAQLSLNRTNKSMLKIRDHQREAEEEWKENSSSMENERVEYKGRVNYLLSRVRLPTIQKVLSNIISFDSCRNCGNLSLS